MPAADPDRDDLALLTAAAEAAGRLALTFWRGAIESWDKGGGAGPVSEADLAVDRMLAAELRAARPDYGWLSEESEDDPARLAAGRAFVVDPIDGTRAFLAGEPSFAVAIAVVEAGAPVAGVVHLPARAETYGAARGGGARLDGAPIRASDRRRLQGASALASRSQLAPEKWPGGPPPVTPAFRPSLAWRLCLVASGRFDSLITLRPAHEWDIAAGVLIAAEAGAPSATPDGTPPRFNRPDPRAPGLICAPPPLLAAILARL